MKNKISRKTLNLILISLVALVMITAVLSGNLLAKYATGAEGEVQTGRVAKFVVDIEKGVSEQEFNITTKDMKPGGRYVQPIQVKNNSEVMVECTLTAVKTNNLPLIFKVGGEIMDPPIIKHRIPVKGEDFETELAIEWPEEYNDIKYTMMVDAIKLSLSVIQVD